MKLQTALRKLIDLPEIVDPASTLIDHRSRASFGGVMSHSASQIGGYQAYLFAEKKLAVGTVRPSRGSPPLRVRSRLRDVLWRRELAGCPPSNA
jgi:hypothetical protein